MTKCDTAAVADWLIDGARSASRPEQVLAQLCDGLVACGIPLWRVAVFVRTLHPQVTGRRFLWRAEAGVEIGELPFERLDTSEYLDSPVVRLYATSAPMRRRLTDEREAADFAVLRDLRAEGATDYLASPLLFTDGTVHAVTWTTRDPGGFTDAQIAGLEAVVAPLARVAETYALRRTARTLLDTYVGSHAGERILSGQIRRGHTEAIRAAIWLSDMRGFTALADRLSPQALISLLNRYFDCQVLPILDRSGEVLKFMGDGLLAIFPLDDDGDVEDACTRALEAADESRRRIAELASATVADGVADLRLGIALHVGEVLYGNIGGGNRLDFTCIGPAVNLAARLEELAGKLRRSVIVSSDFASHCALKLASLGQFSLSGVAAQQTVYGLADEAPRGPVKDSVA
ncbi:MAG TPA: adenylate/guanylate cyclase domain-containing protein [Casimicrobiaceae bacterium]|nr:adenylate/guanylate cyclase domain-containing protein [Casimicrobiaceae bacterium]